MEKAPVDSPKPCMNCGRPLPPAVRYCGDCGQDHRYPRLNLRELAFDAAGELFALDRPWFATLRGLFPEPGTMARGYVEGARVGLVGPVRFLLTLLAVQFVVLQAAAIWLGGQAPIHSGWLSAGLLGLSVPLAAGLRLFCQARERDLAEAIVFACYAMGAVTLFFAAWFGCFRTFLFWADSHGWHSGIALFAPVTLAILGIVLPLYWATGARRFFGCSWWLALLASYVACVAGLIGVASLIHVTS